MYKYRNFLSLYLKLKKRNKKTKLKSKNVFLLLQAGFFISEKCLTWLLVLLVGTIVIWIQTNYFNFQSENYLFFLFFWSINNKSSTITLLLMIPWKLKNEIEMPIFWKLFFFSSIQSWAKCNFQFFRFIMMNKKMLKIKKNQIK